jgi:hypothetical protein
VRARALSASRDLIARILCNRRKIRVPANELLAVIPRSSLCLLLMVVGGRCPSVRVGPRGDLRRQLASAHQPLHPVERWGAARLHGVWRRDGDQFVIQSPGPGAGQRDQLPEGHYAQEHRRRPVHLDGAGHRRQRLADPVARYPDRLVLQRTCLLRSGHTGPEPDHLLRDYYFESEYTVTTLEATVTTPLRVFTDCLGLCWCRSREQQNGAARTQTKKP